VARLSRRELLERAGWAGLGALGLASVPGTLRFLLPRSARTDRGVLDVGSVQDYGTAAVVTRWVARNGLWIVHRHGRLFALEAKCTHLGCTPRWEPDRGVFECPCHGSRFSPEGQVLNGPAVRSLARFAIRTQADQVLVDPTCRSPLERAERDPRFWVPI
jgi:cytochrome b6-f complex iron-sulfur subunit